jgi:hypothetical protein
VHYGSLIDAMRRCLLMIVAMVASRQLQLYTVQMLKAYKAVYGQEEKE